MYDNISTLQLQEEMREGSLIASGMKTQITH